MTVPAGETLASLTAGSRVPIKLTLLEAQFSPKDVSPKDNGSAEHEHRPQMAGDPK